MNEVRLFVLGLRPVTVEVVPKPDRRLSVGAKEERFLPRLGRAAEVWERIEEVGAGGGGAGIAVGG